MKTEVHDVKDGIESESQPSRRRSLQKLLESLVPDEKSRARISRQIKENAQLDARFVFMNTLAGIVATFGLLANSTATVIGAMVIATLLGSISGIALALVHRDLKLLRQSLLSTVVVVGLVLAISLIIGWFHHWMPLTTEVLVRTHPNALDLAIAIAGGAAGAYATVSPRVSAGLVGVAIATALVPPIAACGICLSHGETLLALGAFELFLTNFAAIQLTSSVMMWLFGFRKVGSLSAVRLLLRNSASIAVLIVLGFVLSVNLVRTLRKHQLEASIRQHIETTVDSVDDARLWQLNFKYEATKDIEVTAVIITPSKFNKELEAEIQGAGLESASSRQIDFELLYILSSKFEQAATGEVGTGGSEAKRPSGTRANRAVKPQPGGRAPGEVLLEALQTPTSE